MDFLQAGLFVIVLMVVFVLGGAYGWDLRERQAAKKVESIKKQVEKAILKETENVIHITIEEHDGRMFVYDKNNHTFMAQGSNKDELEEALSSRFPGKRFAASEEDLTKAGLIS